MNRKYLLLLLCTPAFGMEISKNFDGNKDKEKRNAVIKPLDPVDVWRAAENADLKKIKECIEAKIDPDVNFLAKTPLAIAIEKGYASIVEELLKARVSPNYWQNPEQLYYDIKYETPLTLAASRSFDDPNVLKSFWQPALMPIPAIRMAKHPMKLPVSMTT